MNIKLTKNQMYLVEKHVLDLSNVRLGGDLSLYKNLDKSDRFRVIIYNSHKYDGKNHVLTNLDLDVIKYIIGEVYYYTSDSFDRARSERITAKLLLKKLKKYSTVDGRRDILLKEIID